MNFPPNELYGIIGHPLGHSLSPQIFAVLFPMVQRQAVYFRWDIEPKKLPDFLTAVRTLPICGVSVTIPHKEAILPYLEKLSSRAKRAKAVNTLYWEGNRLCGDNTDIAGFLEPLEKYTPKKALVFGYGGAARAVLAGLQEKGISTLLTGRSPQKAEALLKDFPVTFLPWEERMNLSGRDIDLMINCTPLGMLGMWEKESPFPYFDKIDFTGLAYDVVYRPNPTRFLREAAAAGWKIQDGLDMFLHQAIAQFQCWTGEEAKSEFLTQIAINYPCLKAGACKSPN